MSRAPAISLSEFAAWIFDLDGTLTVAAHDFDAIRAELGLPVGRPILESLAEVPVERRAVLELRLRELELEIAARARPASGAVELLEQLAQRNIPHGIVTRNTSDNARVTLEGAGLREFFSDAVIIGRDEAPPKPDPGGLRILVEGWGVEPARVAMVGDFRFDLLAAHAIGAAAIYVDPSGAFPWRESADRSVHSLEELLEELAGEPVASD
jgi:HAD superfamily hydrolase (TIGR01509 family)